MDNDLQNIFFFFFFFFGGGGGGGGGLINAVFSNHRWS